MWDPEYQLLVALTTLLNELLNILAQFDVPISQIEKMFPTVVVRSEIDLDEWPPFWPFGLSNQAQACLSGCSIRL